MNPDDSNTGGQGPKPRSRDRAATASSILDAAQKILTEDGPSGFGVNAVARAAGVDKQLIYRYYGGLEGLLDALGLRLAQWWQDRLSSGGPIPPPASYGALIEALAVRLLHILRTEPLARQSTLWELTDASGLVRTLSASRGRALTGWMEATRGNLRPPEGVDAAAINAVVVSAISYAVLASRTTQSVVGLAAESDADWDRIGAAVRQILRAVYRGD